MEAAPGSYAMAGFSADMLKARHFTMEANRGIFQWSGFTSNLSRQSYLLTATRGQFAMTGSTATLTHSSASSSLSATESWLYRSTLPGTFRKLRFDTVASVNNFRFSSGVGLDSNPTAPAVGSYVRRNPTEGIIGDGALELEQMTSGNMNSYLWVPFDSSRPTWQFNETGFNRGPGEEFYVQVWVKTNCGGDNSTGGAGRKVFSVTRGSASYTFNEIVVQDTEYRGVMQMYQGMGPTGTAYDPFLEARGASDFDLQPGADYVAEPSYCSYQAGDYENQAACATWFNDEWVQYRLHVIPSTDGVADGTIELEFWKTGMATSKKAMSRSSCEMNYDSDKPDGYNHFIAWIYETGRTSGPANQKQWYDQIIISRNPIPFEYELSAHPAWYTSSTTSEWRTFSGGPADTLSAVDPCPAGTCSYSGTERQPSMVTAWCGAAASPNSLIIAAQGGHSNYAGNEVYEFVFNTATPRWFRRIDPSTSLQSNVAYFADGKPNSRHGYKNDCYIGTGTNGGRWFSPFGVSLWGSVTEYNSSTTGKAASWQQGTASYDAQSTFADYPGARDYDGVVEYDPVGHKVWVSEPGATGNWRLFSLDVATNTWTTYANSSVGLHTGVTTTGFIDPIRRVLVVQSGSTIWVRDLAFPNNPGRPYTVSGLTGNAMAYEPVSGKWVHWGGGKTLRVITPPSSYRSGDGSTLNALNASATYTVGATITPSGGSTPTSPASNGTYGRFAYIANPRGFCVVNATNESMYFFKIPTAGI
jgi:hypothetical protein